MSTTSDIIDELEDLFDLDELGDPGLIFNAKPCKMIFHGREAAIQDQEAGGEKITVEVPVSQVLRPVLSDVWQYDNCTWKLLEILEGGPETGSWLITLTRSSRRST